MALRCSTTTSSSSSWSSILMGLSRKDKKVPSRPTVSHFGLCFVFILIAQASWHGTHFRQYPSIFSISPVLARRQRSINDYISLSTNIPSLFLLLCLPTTDSWLRCRRRTTGRHFFSLSQQTKREKYSISEMILRSNWVEEFIMLSLLVFFPSPRASSDSIGQGFEEKQFPPELTGKGRRSLQSNLRRGNEIKINFN